MGVEDILDVRVGCVAILSGTVSELFRRADHQRKSMGGPKTILQGCPITIKLYHISRRRIGITIVDWLTS